MDFAAKALVVSMDRSTNDALNPISTRRLDLEIAAALLKGAGQLSHIATVGHSMIAQPFRQRLAIGNGRLAEAEQCADFGAVAFEGAVRDRQSVGRYGPGAELPRDVGNGVWIDLLLGAGNRPCARKNSSSMANGNRFARLLAAMRGSSAGVSFHPSGASTG
jgi:hypothetical protein